MLIPRHPGFDGTSRPPQLASIRDLARLYAALLAQLDLHDVTVVGNSIGGWSTCSTACPGRRHPRWSWGAADRIVAPEHGRAYAAALPHARFELIEHAGHLPQLETRTSWPTCSRTS